jgi:hypothetical protein
MQPAENKETLKYDNIVISPRGIAEAAGKEAYTTISGMDFFELD